MDSVIPPEARAALEDAVDVNWCHELSDRECSRVTDALLAELEPFLSAEGWGAARDRITEANAARRDERNRIIALASHVRAQFPADHPKGAMASFADYLRVLEDGE